MKWLWVVFVFAVFLLSTSCTSQESEPFDEGNPILVPSARTPSTYTPQCERPLMGTSFYPGVYISSHLHDYTQNFSKHHDLMTLHFGDTVPWELLKRCEDLNDCDLSSDPQVDSILQEFLATMHHLSLQSQNFNGKLYLAISPLNNDRNGLADNFHGISSLRFDAPGERFSDSEVQELYLRYVTYMVDTFRPDYFSQGIETNMYALSQPDDFSSLMNIMKVSKDLISENFNDVVLVGPTLQWEFHRRGYTNVAGCCPRYKELMQPVLDQWDTYGGAIGISSYPLLFNATVDRLYYDFQAYGLSDVSYFFSEVGMVHEGQSSFIDLLFSLSTQYEILGINWFFFEDVPRFFKRLPETYPYTVFHNNGLVDDLEDVSNPGYHTWHSYLNCTQQPQSQVHLGEFFVWE